MPAGIGWRLRSRNLGKPLLVRREGARPRQPRRDVSGDRPQRRGSWLTAGRLASDGRVGLALPSASVRHPVSGCPQFGSCALRAAACYRPASLKRPPSVKRPARFLTLLFALLVVSLGSPAHGGGYGGAGRHLPHGPWTKAKQCCRARRTTGEPADPVSFFLYAACVTVIGLLSLPGS